MDLEETYRQAVEDEVVESRMFQYRPGRSEPRALRFYPRGRMEDEDGNVFHSWKVLLDDTTRRPTLHLLGQDGASRVSCTMDPDGVWCGRDRHENARVQILTMSDRRAVMWPVLASPARFYRQMPADPEEEDFRYEEALPEQIDWNPYTLDIRDRVDPSVLPAANTAIALVGWNRPTYFQQVVASLAANPLSQELPVFVFLDRAEPAIMEQQEVEAMRAFPHCVVVRRPRNFGCGRNLIDVRRQLFDHLRYDRVFVFEDDLVVGPNYLQYCVNLLDWSEKRYGNVGAVQGWNFCLLSDTEKRSMMHKVQATFTNWWGYLMSRKAWEAINRGMYRYEHLFLGGQYSRRPHRSILSWFKIKDKRIEHPGNPFPTNRLWMRDHDRYFDTPPTGQDAATMHLFHFGGWVRLCPVVNRGVYIGRHGIHMNVNWFERTGFGAVTLNDTTADAGRRAFEPTEEDWAVPCGTDPTGLGLRVVDTLGD